MMGRDNFGFLVALGHAEIKGTISPGGEQSRMRYHRSASLLPGFILKLLSSYAIRI